MKLVFVKSILITACIMAGGLPCRCGAAESDETAAKSSELIECPDDDNKEHVYIFMVNGLTVLPHLYGSMNPIGDMLQQHGYVQSQTATHYFRWSFQDKIRSIYQRDPQARIVLIGYSIGAGVVHGMAETLEKEGIPVALMVYLDGHTFLHNFRKRPCNVERVVCITSSCYILKGAAVKEADYLAVIDKSRHLSVPKKDETMQILLDELNTVAATVPPATIQPPATKATGK